MVTLVAVTARGTAQGLEAKLGGNGGIPRELHEELLEWAAEALGRTGRLTPRRLRRELLAKGRQDLAKEAEGLQRAKNAVAHPPTAAAVARIIEAHGYAGNNDKESNGSDGYRKSSATDNDRKEDGPIDNGSSVGEDKRNNANTK